MYYIIQKPPQFLKKLFKYELTPDNFKAYEFEKEVHFEDLGKGRIVEKSKIDLLKINKALNKYYNNNNNNNVYLYFQQELTFFFF